MEDGGNPVAQILVVGFAELDDDSPDGFRVGLDRFAHDDQGLPATVVVDIRDERMGRVEPLDRISVRASGRWAIAVDRTPVSVG